MKNLLFTLYGLLILGCSIDPKTQQAIDSEALSKEQRTYDLTEFNVWAAADPHVTVDAIHGVEPLQLALRQSEGYWSFLPKPEIKLGGIPPAFDWDIMLLAGDFTSSQFPPKDGEGEILVRQFEVLKKHQREDIYSIAGNHDGDYYDQGIGHWFNK